MDVYRTEEEQIEALKKWWSENGNSLLVGALVAFSAIFGWKAWQNHETEVTHGASVSYQSLYDSVQTATDAKAGSVEDSTVGHLNGKLLEEYSGTTYSYLAALLVAKNAVDKNNLDEAEKQLRWVAESADDAGLRMLAKLRLAKVLLAKEKPEDALKLLNSESSTAFESSFEELKGDIYVGQGDLDKARGAYEKAEAAAKKDQAHRPILQMKLEDLAAGE